MNAISFEQLPTEVTLMRQELREIKEMLKIKVAPPDDGEYMDTDAAATFMRTSPVALRQRVYREKLPHMKVGALLYFKKSDLIGYLESFRVATDAEIEEDLMEVFNVKKSK